MLQAQLANVKAMCWPCSCYHRPSGKRKAGIKGKNLTQVCPVAVELFYRDGTGGNRNLVHIMDDNRVGNDERAPVGDGGNGGVDSGNDMMMLSTGHGHEHVHDVQHQQRHQTSHVTVPMQCVSLFAEGLCKGHRVMAIFAEQIASLALRRTRRQAAHK